MQRAMLNRATMRVADTTEVRGGVTAESIKHTLFSKNPEAKPAASVVPRFKAQRPLVALAAACGLALALPNVGLMQSTEGRLVANWVGTWAVGPQPPFEGLPLPGVGPATPPTFSNQTLRQIVHTSLGGTKVRVRVSNAFGTDSLVIGAARIGLRAAAAQVVPGTNQVLTFSGRTSAISPGALAVSDPINLEVPALGDLSIGLYLPNSTLGNTQHIEARQTNYLLAGDQTASANPAVASPLPANYDAGSYYFLTDVEVYAHPEVGVIVCLGTRLRMATVPRWTRTIAGPISWPSGS